MSTKTNFKRVALVAVAALGLGVLTSVAPANAGTADVTASSLWISTTNSTNGSTVTTTAGGDTALDKSIGAVAITSSDVALKQVDQANGTGLLAGTAGYATWLASGKVAFAAAATTSNYVSVIVTGGTISGAVVKASGGVTYASGNTIIASDTATAMAVAGVATPNSGATTMTISAYEGASVTTAAPTNGTLIGTWVITLAAAGTSNIPNASKSVYAVDTSSSFANTVDQAAGFSVANGGTGYIATTPKDVYGATLTGTHAVTVSATNGAKVGFSAYPTASTAVTTSVPTGIYVVQGTANTAVSTEITLVIDGVTIGSKTISFVGDLVKITATPAGIGKVGGTNTNFVSFKAYDAAGNRVSLTGPSVKGTDTVVTTMTQTDGTTATTTGYLTPTCAYYGTNKSLYLATTNAAGATVASNTFSFSCAGDMYTYKASLDKASYVEGSIATLTISGFDVFGKPSNDLTAIGDATYKPAISGAQMTAVSAPTSTDTTTDGVVTYQFIVGNTAGSYAMAVDLPLITKYGLTDSAKSVSYSVTSASGSVSNADVLKAIVSLIASINKQIAALQKALLKK
jgi:trimeric autotransporter adhesin